MMAFVRHWHADGVVLFYNRTCRLCSLSIGELKQALKGKGIPVTNFEGAGSDPRESNEKAMLDCLEVFIEGVLGLKPLSSY